MYGFRTDKNLTKNITAAIFDLDGVITKTAATHFKAWKLMFDRYLFYRNEKFSKPFAEFTDNDYKQYVDGRPRYEGVQCFLSSREIDIQYGSPEDAPGVDSVCALGNLKNQLFNKIIRTEGVEVYDSTVLLIREFHKCGVKVAVASSSRNCKIILEKMNLMSFFDVCVDGNDLVECNLKGKPDPAIFCIAADRLGCKYGSSIVFEDAISGTQAGKNGNFGLVVGLARNNTHKELRNNGADIVVDDLNEVNVSSLDVIMRIVREEDGWKIDINDYDQSKEKARESLMSLGNGFFCTRGSLNVFPTGKSHYPAIYQAGIYNKLKSLIDGQIIENEDIVNCGEIWGLDVRCYVDDTVQETSLIKHGGEITNNNISTSSRDKLVIFATAKVKECRRKLSLKDGVMDTEVMLEDIGGYQLIVKYHQVVSMHDYHMAAIKYTIIPVNFSGHFIIKTGINCNVQNAGVERYSQLSTYHLDLKQTYLKSDINTIIIGVETETNQSHIRTGIVAKMICKSHDTQVRYVVDKADAEIEYIIDIHKDEYFVCEKIITISNSKQDADYSFKLCLARIKRYNNYVDVFENSAYSWAKIWNNIDIEIKDSREKQKIIRLYLYHLMISCSEHNTKLDASVGPRGLTGEAYRGHIFWDELFIFSFYSRHYPDSAKSMLMYRYNRLNAARQAAKKSGYEGAMFPWQSGSDGSESTQSIHYNPISKKWDEDNSRLQRHVSLAIAYNIYTYFVITNDVDFMLDYGLEILYELCRFFASMSKYDINDGKYHITGVMGPDEFHERIRDIKDPDIFHKGLKDNAYTNIMVSWLFTFVRDFQEYLNEVGYSKRLMCVLNLNNVSNEEIIKWLKIAQNLNLVIKDDIISQFDGYFELKQIDFQKYKDKYGDVERMDRILKAEGLTPDDYQVTKQADLLMIFYNFPDYSFDSDSEVVSALQSKNNNKGHYFNYRYQISDILKNMGYILSEDYIKKNFNYYLLRTTHGSTLSKLVFSRVAMMIGEKDLGEKLFHDVLINDYNDVQGTVGEGVHVGVMGGLVSY